MTAQLREMHIPLNHQALALISNTKELFLAYSIQSIAGKMSRNAFFH